MMPGPRKIVRSQALPRWARWALAFVLAIAWIGSPRGVAMAQRSGGTTHAGTAPGLKVLIDTQWVSAGGYRPFRITITPTRPVTADRTLTFTVQQQTYRNQRAEDRVVQDVEIPAGSKMVQATLSIPPGYLASKFTASENGKLLPGMEFSERRNFRVGRHLGIICVKFPIVELGPLNQAINTSDRGGQHLAGALTKLPSHLPTRWIDFSGIDILWLHIDQLESLSSNQSDTFQAIIDWTSAGGNLCVFGLGSDWQRLVELEKLLAWPDGDQPSDQPSERGWKKPDRKEFGKPIRDLDLNSRHHSYDSVYEDAYTEEPSEPKKIPTVPDNAPFLLRPFDSGMVVALASKEPFPKDSETWSWLLNTLTAERWNWSQRYGLSNFQENTDFYNFLIPGVGLVPTTAFCVLITLFVLLIGPVNYILLRRWKRLHLLLVTIPAGAATVAMTLFLYALFTDGLSTRVRVRSVTRIDQQSGRTSCWSRLSYYAGLASSEGLTFPEDVAIFPLEFRSLQDRSRRLLIWQDDEQYLATGWLPARTFIQYITVRSRTTQHRVEIRPNANHLDVRNRLGTRIEKLLLCNADGKFYWAADIEPDALAKISSIEPSEISPRLRKLFGDAAPAFPEGIDPQNFNSGIFGNRRYYHGYYNSEDEPSQQTGILETSFRPFARCPLSGPAMTPRSYLAIVDRSPEVELGTSAANEEGSFHVIIGKW